MGFMKGSKTGSKADVAVVMDGKGLEVLWELVDLGAMISVGTTKDGGAVSVTVTVDGDWERFYARDSEGLDEWLSELAPQARVLLEEVSASRAQAPRSKGMRGR